MTKLTTEAKQFLANLAAVVPGESTEQVITFASGPADDAGARKAAAMHAANAGRIDRAVDKAQGRKQARAERKARIAAQAA